jgi:hypothetical protein
MRSSLFLVATALGFGFLVLIIVVLSSGKLLYGFANRDTLLAVAASALGVVSAVFLSGIFTQVLVRRRTGQVFVSYSFQDSSVAKVVIRKLEAADFRVFDPASSIVAGQAIEKSIANAIRESNFLVVILTQRSADSLWLPKEVDLASKLGTRIVPVVEVGAPVLPVLEGVKFIQYKDQPSPEQLQAIVRAIRILSRSLPLRNNPNDVTSDTDSQ